MSVRSTLGTIGFVGICIALLLSAGQPVPFGVVTSDSMTPALERGDIYLAVPPVSSVHPGEGDIVVYQSADGWTVHRVVDSTEHGFITQGDANPFTDQAVGDPPIPEGAIVGVVPAWRGHPIAISKVPRGGTVLTGMSLVLGIVVLSVAMGSRGADAAPSPAGIALLCGLLPWIGWLIRSNQPVPEVDTELINSGFVPLLTLLEYEGGHRGALVIMPGGGVLLDDVASLSIIIGLSPPWLIETVAGHNVYLALGVVSVMTAMVGYVVASLLTVVFPPERVR